MVSMVRALVLAGYGINCEVETAFAFRKAGAEAKIIHFNDIAASPALLDAFDILAVPGGFSFADDLGSGKVLAIKLKHRIGEAFGRFVEEGKLVIGICNGFQVLVKLGALPNFKGNFTQEATLTFNDSGRFEDRWVHLKGNAKSRCIFTRGIDDIYLPVRHGEGKFVAKDEATRKRLWEKGCIALQYVDAAGKLAGYPWNPNGSVDNVAGICDEAGRVFGMMPHPEAFTHCTNHPHWTRNGLPEEGAGLKIFRNAVEFASENL